MARGRRGGPKPPPAPVVYEESDAIAEVASRLIRLFVTKFGWTTSFKVGYVMVKGSKPKSDRRFDAMAKFKKVPPLYHGLAGFDAVVEVQEWAWDSLDPTQQEALVAHELCHGSMSEKGVLRVERHDLEEFRFVVRNYGAWAQDIAAFDEQLALFDEKGGTFKAPAAEQQKLEPTSSDVQAAIDEAAAKGEPVPVPRRRPNGHGTQPPALS